MKGSDKKEEIERGKQEAKVMNTRGKSGQKLENWNEKSINGKSGKAGNSPSHNKMYRRKIILKMQREVIGWMK